MHKGLLIRLKACNVSIDNTTGIRTNRAVSIDNPGFQTSVGSGKVSMKRRTDQFPWRKK
jgi:hypothetical protein